MDCFASLAMTSAATTELDLQRHRHRHMVRWPLPAAGVAQNPEIADRILQRAGNPDVVEPAAAVADGPVGGAVAPPGVDFLRQWNPLACDVVPFAGGKGCRELLDLDR